VNAGAGNHTAVHRPAVSARALSFAIGETHGTEVHRPDGDGRLEDDLPQDREGRVAAQAVRCVRDDCPMNVADARGRKFDAATGIGFAILGIIGFALPGTPPKADDPSAKIGAYFADHRKEVLVGNFVLGVAAILFLWFAGALRSYLRSAEGGEGRLSAASFGGGIAGITLLLAGAAILNMVAFEFAKQAGGAPDLARAVFDASGAFFAMSALCFGVFLAAAACSGARSGSLPPWAYWTGSVVAVLQLLAGLALFVESGFFATGGGFPTFVAPIAAFLWIIAVSVVMMRRDGVPPVPRTAP
jgi:hypothetical protein